MTYSRLSVKFFAFFEKKIRDTSHVSRISHRGVPFARRPSNERYAYVCVCMLRPEGESVPSPDRHGNRAARVAPPLARSVVRLRSCVFGRVRTRSGGFAHERGQPVSRRWQSPRDQFRLYTYSRRSVIGVQPSLSRSVPDLAYRTSGRHSRDSSRL